MRRWLVIHELKVGELLLAVGLGSNLPPVVAGAFDLPSLQPRLRALEGALSLLAEAGLRTVATSRVVECAPQGVPTPQPDYLNACVLLHARDLSVEQAFLTCRRIEREAGREGKGDLGARPLDLDLLAAWSGSAGGQAVILDPPADGELILPHPRLAVRAFVLNPLAEIAAELSLQSPSGTKTVVELLRSLNEAERDAPTSLQTVSAPSFPRSWSDGQC